MAGLEQAHMPTE